MRHFPVFIDLIQRIVVVSGARECAVAKLRLLLHTDAQIMVYGKNPLMIIQSWAREGKITLFERPIQENDVQNVTLFYAANDDATEDARVAHIGRKISALTNIVDNLEDSQFITPAIVDRSPVTIAIGTEGAAPVLARKIKQHLEEVLPSTLGLLARIGQRFRPIANAIPMGRKRRDFWSKFYFSEGPRALAMHGEHGAESVLKQLFTDAHMDSTVEKGHVTLIGAGNGDPELLTLKARAFLHEADVIIHDPSVQPQILELARREAILIKTKQTNLTSSKIEDEITDLTIKHALKGRQIVRLKSGDPVIFGPIENEIKALFDAGISCDIIPGVSATSAAIYRSLAQKNKQVPIQKSIFARETLNKQEAV